MNNIYISEEQNKYLKENKGLLFEYFGQVSNPLTDGHILNDLQIWVYGDDRQNFTPHCHVMKKDKSVEFEVSLIDWSVIRVKRGTPTKDMKKSFIRWLETENSTFKGVLNKLVLFRDWDSNNPNNHLLEFCERHKITEIGDRDLRKYLSSKKEERDKFYEYHKEF